MLLQDLKPNYFIADGASMSTLINEFAEYNATPYSIYLGMEEETIADVGPFLVDIEGNDSAMNWLLNEGKSQSWGIFLKTELKFDDLLAHLQSLIIVEDEDGKELYFRFYDPRVINNFLPTCDTPQLKQFFGKVDFFVAENINKDYLTLHRIEQSKLKSEKVQHAIVETISKEIQTDDSKISNNDNDKIDIDGIV